MRRTKTTTGAAAGAIVKAKPARNVPLHQASEQIQLIDDLLNQIDRLAESPTDDPEGLGPEELEALIEKRRNELASALGQMRQEQQGLFEQAINRMLNRASFETRQLVGEEAMARYLYSQARTLNGGVRRRRGRIRSIKASIATALQVQKEARLETNQHRMHLSRNTKVVIDEELIPSLDELLELNEVYPGIITQLRFHESGRLMDVEFRSSQMMKYLKRGDASEDLAFARIHQQHILVVPTISEAAMAKQVNVEEGDYGPELDWV